MTWTRCAALMILAVMVLGDLFCLKAASQADNSYREGSARTEDEERFFRDMVEHD